MRLSRRSGNLRRSNKWLLRLLLLQLLLLLRRSDLLLLLLLCLLLLELLLKRSRHLLLLLQTRLLLLLLRRSDLLLLLLELHLLLLLLRRPNLLLLLRLLLLLSLLMSPNKCLQLSQLFRTDLALPRCLEQSLQTLRIVLHKCLQGLNVRRLLLRLLSWLRLLLRLSGRLTLLLGLLLCKLVCAHSLDLLLLDERCFVLCCLGGVLRWSLWKLRRPLLAWNSRALLARLLSLLSLVVHRFDLLQ